MRIRHAIVGILPYVKLQICIGMQIREQISVRRLKKSGGKGSVALLNESIQFGCVSQDSEPPESFPRKSGKIGIKSRRHNLQVLLSYRSMGNARTLFEKPEEREFVVDSGASMDMLSKKDLSSAELVTLRKSRNPTTVVTANGEVQTNEEAQVYVHDLDLFVTVQILDDTPAVLSFGKLCKDHGDTWSGPVGKKTQLTPNGTTILCNAEYFVPIVVPGLSPRSSPSSSSTSFPQDSSSTSPSPARLRSDDTHAQASGDRGDHLKIKNNN